MSSTSHPSTKFEASADALTMTSSRSEGAKPAIPPLEQGDHLTWPEFERRSNVIAQGAASPEHAEFVARLKAKSS